MSIFNDMLKSDESLFADAVALDYDFLPKIIPHREKEQRQIALCMKPLFAERNGKNAFLFGPPGIGKTAAVRHLFRELNEETDDIDTIYVNCWQKNTSYKILLEVCNQLGYKFVHNKKTDELFEVAKKYLNKKSAVFCFDEIDKAEDLDFIYMILEQVYRKSIILITNYKTWILDMDERLKSRINLEFLEFKKYDERETTDILRQRLKYAFVSGVWEDDAFTLSAKKAYQLGDLRSGLYILKESGNAAEERASTKIKKEHVEIAIQKLDEFNIKKTSDLKEEDRFVLKVVKSNSGKKIGDLFNDYKKAGGGFSYKTFQRKIAFLEKNKFISTAKTQGGKDGNTTIIKYERDTKLSDF